MATLSLPARLMVLCLLPILAVTGCSAADPTGGTAPTARRSVVLDLGEAARLNDGTLVYLRLVNDSRCPPDVQCVRAGDATIELEWQPDDGSSRTFRLRTGAEKTVGGHRIRLVDLARGDAPRATLDLSAPSP